MRSDSICVIIPTYNNSGTILNVISDVLQYGMHLYVVCDGTTDGTEEKVRNLYGNDVMVTVLGYSENRGKGFALMTGFKAAAGDGFRYAITIDSDGQHYAKDIPAFVKVCAERPGCLLTGNRCAGSEGQASGSRFANRFSNFWFTVQTWQNLADTQCGYRLYPLDCVCGIHLFSARYEAELELMVRMAWQGVGIVSVPVNVYYPPADERVSHFRKGRDFARISVLNTFLTFAAVLYGYPSILFHKLSSACRK